MIARMWRGATRAGDAESYVDYLRGTGLREYHETPGNGGAWVFWRLVDDERAEFVTVSLWESREAVARFAGPDIDRAVFYPEDDRYLLERDLGVTHFEAVAG